MNIGLISDWKYKHKSPFEAYVNMVDNYVDDRNLSATLKEQAKKQYKEGYSVQDIELNGKKLRFIIFENNGLIHINENMEDF